MLVENIEQDGVIQYMADLGVNLKIGISLNNIKTGNLLFKLQVGVVEFGTDQIPPNLYFIICNLYIKKTKHEKSISWSSKQTKTSPHELCLIDLQFHNIKSSTT